MSLQLAAQHLASKGRGRDTRLIHVSPRELQGLQALAKAKGGSLTINPDTGLPEAGFLEDILPIAATAALMFVPGGPALAGSVGGAFGASGALAAGIGTGLLAGGASMLGQALSGGKVDMRKAATTGLLSGVAGGMGYTAPTSDVVTPVKALEAASAVPAGAGSGAGNVFAYDAAGALQPANYAPEITGATSFSTAPPSPNKSFFGNLTGKEKLGYGLAGTAALSLLGENNQQSNTNQDQSPAYIRPYSFSQTRNPRFGEPGESYFKQSYTAQPAYRAAGGGLMDAAMYPQSGIDRTQYATPTQMPTSAEVVGADYDAPTNPYSGEPLARFAEGGNTKDAVKAYNDILAKRATEEYVNAPMLAAFRSAPPQAQAQATPDVGGGVRGLYQYYLGRQPSEAEIPQYSDQIRSTGMATPEEAAYFRQFIGGEQAATGYKPTGADPFAAQQGGQGLPGTGIMGSGTMDPMGQQRGMPTFAYNPQTRQYTSTGFMPPPIDMMANQAPVPDGMTGGAAGGIMPDDLKMSYAAGGDIQGYNLGGYSDGGRLLKGPGDGVSDDIPAVIGNKQPARLADGEFVIPARIVSEIGNGSTDAGAKKLYAMMDRVQEKRKKSSKKGKFAIDSKADKVLPA
jgi:hypothetical protein